MDDLEEEVQELKFEELDDIIEDIDNWDEIKEAKDCSFNKFYGPIRSLFASDSSLLEKFGLCTNHTDRLKLLVQLEVMQQLL